MQDRAGPLECPWRRCLLLRQLAGPPAAPRDGSCARGPDVRDAGRSGAPRTGPRRASCMTLLSSMAKRRPTPRPQATLPSPTCTSPSASPSPRPAATATSSCRALPPEHASAYADARSPAVRGRRTRTLTSTRNPSRLMTVTRRSTVKRDRSALRIREMSAAAILVRACAARTLSPSLSSALMISAARTAFANTRWRLRSPDRHAADRPAGDPAPARSKPPCPRSGPFCYNPQLPQRFSGGCRQTVTRL